MAKIPQKITIFFFSLSEKKNHQVAKIPPNKTHTLIGAMIITFQ
jgi:hypothetical protein